MAQTYDESTNNVKKEIQKDYLNGGIEGKHKYEWMLIDEFEENDTTSFLVDRNHINLIVRDLIKDVRKENSENKKLNPSPPPNENDLFSENRREVGHINSDCRDLKDRIIKNISQLLDKKTSDGVHYLKMYYPLRVNDKPMIVIAVDNHRKGLTLQVVDNLKDETVRWFNGLYFHLETLSELYEQIISEIKKES